MNKKPSIEGLEKELSWEEAVGRYLEQTPDYFLRHPELLAALVLPHPEAGRAVSLVERQVRVLRDRNEQSTHQLQELIAFARDNDQLGERVQRFALAMIDSDTLDEALDTAQDMLRQEFSLDGVAVRLTGNPRPSCPRQEFVAPDDAMLDGLLTSLTARNGQPLCGAVHAAATLEALFGAQAGNIRSTAVIGLTRHTLRGVLVLASRDPQRFRADMGTVYLVRLGELLMAGVARHMVTASIE
ncbi:MAG TPA: DUF484 family protein [Acidiferrobacterales bacterium]|nr:DUF484 family protein [Acidiferrobacterales bacterium]